MSAFSESVVEGAALAWFEALGYAPFLVDIARELVATVKRNVIINCIVRDNVCADLRVIVKRILRKYGYPPDKQERATQTVLEQAALLSAQWAA